jgi:hypothetical protein
VSARMAFHSENAGRSMVGPVIGGPRPALRGKRRALRAVCSPGERALWLGRRNDKARSGRASDLYSGRYDQRADSIRVYVLTQEGHAADPIAWVLLFELSSSSAAGSLEFR